MKSKKSVNNILKKISIVLLSLFCAVTVFFAVQTEIYNDGAEAELNAHGGRLITRTQIDGRGFFTGE